MIVKQHHRRFNHLGQGLNHARTHIRDFIQCQQGRSKDTAPI